LSPAPSNKKKRCSIVHISRKAEYAVLIMAYLAADDSNSPVPSREIAETYDLPQNLVPQLASKLRKKGWVSGKPGPGGGLTLEVDPSQLSIREVVDTIENPIAIRDCLMSENICSNSQDCPLREVWADAQKQLLDVLDSVSIKEMGNRLTNKS